MIANRTTNSEPMSAKITKYRGDYIGMRFGSLTVIAYPADENGTRLGGCVCRCDCGAEVEALSMSSLFAGFLKTCAECRSKLLSESTRAANKSRRYLTKYSDGNDEYVNERLFKVWRSMRDRCENESCRSYADYGAKGVEVCDEWRDYRTFREWALATGYDEGAPRGECTIDRIDPFGDYEPSNCRLANWDVQQHNKRVDWLNLDSGGRRAALATAGTYVRS